jgi:hypothetical protein
MPKPIHVLLGVLALLAAGSVAWLIRVMIRPELVVAPAPRPRAPAAVVPAIVYAAESIGIAESDHPAITSVVITDLDGDGLPDVVACDATENQVSWIRQAPRGTWTETVLPVQVPGPVRLLAGDFTGDGKTELLVGCQGRPGAGDDRTGRVVLIEHPADPAQRTSHTVLEQVWPVTDLARVARQPDGRIGLAIATAGRQQGRLYHLERTAAGELRSEVLATGGRMLAVAAPPPAHPETIASLEAGERDLVRVFRRTASGAWESETRGTAPDPAWGGTMLAWADVNHDGTAELVVANGDRSEQYPDPHGGQGLQWLAATGADSGFHAIGSFPGVHAFAVADLNGDGRPDLVSVATGIRPVGGDAAAVVAWINRPPGFERVSLPGPIERVAAVAVGDLDGNGVPVIVTGADHARSPAERSGRLTLWRRH